MRKAKSQVDYCPRLKFSHIPLLSCKNRPGYVTTAEDAYEDASYIEKYCRGNFKECYYFKNPSKKEERPRGPRVPVLANWLFRG